MEKSYSRISPSVSLRKRSRIIRAIKAGDKSTFRENASKCVEIIVSNALQQRQTAPNQTQSTCSHFVTLNIQTFFYYKDFML